MEQKPLSEQTQGIIGELATSGKLSDTFERLLTEHPELSELPDQAIVDELRKTIETLQAAVKYWQVKNPDFASTLRVIRDAYIMLDLLVVMPQFTKKTEPPQLPVEPLIFDGIFR